MERITQLDLAYWTQQLNMILADSNSARRVIVRNHGYNNFTRLMECDTRYNEISDTSIITGTKREVYNTLRAMIKMYEMLTKS